MPKITEYTTVSSNTPSTLSLIDISEKLPNDTFDTRKMSLQQLINYINPIPFPCMTIVLSNFVSQGFTSTVVKNTIGNTSTAVTNTVFVTQGGFQIYSISHPNFTIDNCIITHSGIATNSNSYANVFNTTNGKLDIRNYTDNVDSLNAMKQVVITFYKTN